MLNFFQNNKTKKIAVIFAILLILWMISGLFKSSENADETQATPPFKVQTKLIKPQSFKAPLSLYGETEAMQKTTIFSEIQSKVQKILVKEGDLVKKGKEMVKLDVKHFKEQLNNAKSSLKNRELKLTAEKRLFEKGLSSNFKVNEAKSAYNAAIESLEKAKTNYENVIIRAPFDGRVENIFIKIGDIANLQKQIMDFASVEKSVIVAYVPEKNLSQLRAEMPAVIKLVDGRKFNGSILFIGNVAEEQMRSYRVEIKVEQNLKMPKDVSQNAMAYDIPSGMTAEIQIFKDAQLALKIPQSSLSINDAGDIGVKIVTEGDIVKFHKSKILHFEEDGHIWIIPNDLELENKPEFELIHIGHAFVDDGATVNVQNRSDS